MANIVQLVRCLHAGYGDSVINVLLVELWQELWWLGTESDRLWSCQLKPSLQNAAFKSVLQLQAVCRVQAA